MRAYRSSAGTLRTHERAARGSAPSLDDPRFESLLLRLHASIDIQEFWSAQPSILHEFVPHDACVAYLNYVDFARTWDASRIFATANAHKPPEWLQRRREVNMMPAFALPAVAGSAGYASAALKTQLTSVYKKCGVRSRSRLLAAMMPRLSYD